MLKVSSSPSLRGPVIEKIIILMREKADHSVPALLENAIQPILDKLESSAPASTAELENHITHAFHTELLRAQNAIIKAIQTQTPPSASSPPRSSPSIEQVSHLMYSHGQADKTADNGPNDSPHQLA